MQQVDVEIGRLEAENEELFAQVAALKKRGGQGGDAQDAIILRGVTGQIGHLEQQIEDATAELMAITLRNADLDAAFACETSRDARALMTRLQNEVGALEIEEQQKEGENRGLKRVRQAQAKDMKRLRQIDEVQERDTARIKNEMAQLKFELAASVNRGDAEEQRKFCLRLRLEQERTLALTRKLRASSARASDGTALAIAQRKLTEASAVWEEGRRALAGKLGALRERHADVLAFVEADVDEDAGQQPPVPDSPEVSVALSAIARAKASLQQLDAEIVTAQASLKSHEEDVEAVRRTLRGLGLYVADCAADGPSGLGGGLVIVAAKHSSSSSSNNNNSGSSTGSDVPAPARTKVTSGGPAVPFLRGVSSSSKQGVLRAQGSQRSMHSSKPFAMARVTAAATPASVPALACAAAPAAPPAAVEWDAWDVAYSSVAMKDRASSHAHAHADEPPVHSRAMRRGTVLTSKATTSGSDSVSVSASASTVSGAVGPASVSAAEAWRHSAPVKPSKPAPSSKAAYAGGRRVVTAR